MPPTMMLKVGKVALVLCALLGLIVGVSVKSYSVGASVERERAQRAELEQQRQLNLANEANRALEAEHEKHVADLRAEFATAQAKEKADDEKTVGDLRSGIKRLRLQVAACSPTNPGEADLAPIRIDGAGTAELSPETAATLWTIAADGDRCARKLTALQEWARSAVQLCSGGH